MHDPAAKLCRLSLDACRLRQQRLAERLGSRGLDGALLSARNHVHYFSGFWQASYHTPLFHLTSDGVATLVAPEGVCDEPVAAEEIELYAWHDLGTLVDDFEARAIGSITSRLQSNALIAVDRLPQTYDTRVRWVDFSGELLDMRRAKDADEVELVRQAILGCEAAYTRAAQILTPNVREIDIFAEMQSVAVRAIGEPLGEMGNDFQAGTGGGQPRCRGVEAGELMPLDVSINFRGYRCDLCRTFVVGGSPTAEQSRAADLVLAALDFIDQSARQGVSGGWLYEQVRERLLIGHAWEFPHHLGHGIGLGIHEAPRLNPHWDDMLTTGDLFTAEPGLYGDNLRGGVRIEDNYWIGPQGLTKLSSYPRGLVLPTA